jgi:hypothetical protein
LDELEDEPTMGRFGEDSEGVAQGGQGVTIGEGIGPGKVGGRDGAQEDSINKSGIMVRLKI